jgi:hypothetical protein
MKLALLCAPPALLSCPIPRTIPTEYFHLVHEINIDPSPPPPPSVYSSCFKPLKLRWLLDLCHLLLDGSFPKHLQVTPVCKHHTWKRIVGVKSLRTPYPGSMENECSASCSCRLYYGKDSLTTTDYEMEGPPNRCRGSYNEDKYHNASAWSRIPVVLLLLYPRTDQCSVFHTWLHSRNLVHNFVALKRENM